MTVHGMNVAAQDMIDRPFAPPLVCVMDVPFPPSTNEIWRRVGSRTVLSRAYRSWKHEADMAVVANGCWRNRTVMPGAFTALVMLDRAMRRPNMDVDNRLKAPLDWMQRVGIVKNDCLCEDARVMWVSSEEAPRGCRILLRSLLK